MITRNRQTDSQIYKQTDRQAEKLSITQCINASYMVSGDGIINYEDHK